jgi:inosine/xanthosine triphosphatase
VLERSFFILLMDNHNIATLRVAVGTKNPCKIKAVECALRRVAQCNAQKFTFQVRGFNVDSGVSSQPWNDEETKLGAMNRARNAYYFSMRQGDDVIDGMAEPLPHIAVGIEGGLEWENIADHSSTTFNQPAQLYCMAWIAVYGEQTPLTSKFFGVSPLSESGDVNASIGSADNNSKPFYGLSKTAMFRLPTSLSELVEKGIELGRADDLLFDRTNSKHSSGTIGLLTNSLIDRSDFYEQAVILALIPWIQPTLYPDSAVRDSDEKSVKY